LKFGLPTVAALGAGAAVAVAAIPGGGGTITGCYITNPDGARYGALRVIDPSLRDDPRVPAEQYSCDQDEATITWNQQGPQGPPGPQGAAGGNGSNGAPGAKGDTGTPLIGGTSFSLTNSAGKTFLKLDGIAGESTDKTHKGDIELDSFSLGTRERATLPAAPLQRLAAAGLLQS
jgi:hypothetical protein